MCPATWKRYVPTPSAPALAWCSAAANVAEGAVCVVQSAFFSVYATATIFLSVPVALSGGRTSLISGGWLVRRDATLGVLDSVATDRASVVFFVFAHAFVKDACALLSSGIRYTTSGP